MNDDEWNARILEALKPHDGHELTVRMTDAHHAELLCKTCDAWVMWAPALDQPT